MKTTIELPAELMREVELRALREGRRLDDAAANLLRIGLASPPRLASSRITTDPKTGLPVVRCGPNAPANRMTAAELIALEQESQQQDDLGRIGLLP